VFLPLLWTLVAMAVILGLALAIVLVVAYPHREEVAKTVRGASRPRLWLDDRRG
jgi:hypothetical protein